MSSKVFVGSLPYSLDKDGLAESFGEFGSVVDANIVFDRETRRSRGYGFVTFSTPEEAQAAIAGGANKQIDGRSIIVNPAAERDPNAPRPAFQGRNSNYGGQQQQQQRRNYNNNGYNNNNGGGYRPRRNYGEDGQQQEGGYDNNNNGGVYRNYNNNNNDGGFRRRPYNNNNNNQGNYGYDNQQQQQQQYYQEGGDNQQ
ncbi:hypothetical protein GGI15_002562 [Coemansia interrupta]|uniref:RRM domain-containing protein n=1 Tax=Coemansia interrupta TaxID=1126814 RepID=A0A9W8LL19_9FUNG|nr:hypothetical protein GGI15_002562 [Coemansia interrupta]